MNGVARWVIGRRRQLSPSSTDMQSSVPLRSENHMLHGLSLNQRKLLIGRDGKFLSLRWYSHTCGRMSMTMTRKIQYVIVISVSNSHVLSRLSKVYSCTSASLIHLHFFWSPFAMFQAISALKRNLELLSPSRLWL